MSVSDRTLGEKQGCIGIGNLVERLEALARDNGWLDRPAYHVGAETYRFADVYEGAGRAAAAYTARGLGAGSRIALVLPDGIDMVWAFLGAMRIGAVAVPVNSTMHPDELRRAVEIAVPDAIVCEEDPGGRPADVIAPEDLRADGVAPYAPTTPDSPAYAVFTSGTTGDPKLCFHTHGDPGVFEQAIGSVVGITPDDVTFSVSRMYFAYGLGNSVFLPLHRGGTTVLSRARATEDDALRIIKVHGVTVFYGQPSFYARLLRHPDHALLSGLRLALVAGEVLPDALEARLRRVLGERLLNIFGTTEIGHALVANAIGRSRDHTIGRILPPYRMRIVDEAGAEVPPGVPGALEVAGPSIALGVGRGSDPPLRAGDSWYATGDAATADEDGYVRLHGRLDDVEIVGGQNVHPAETEDLLMRHPEVREAAVCSARRETGVTTLRAFVALEDDASPEKVRAELLAGARAALTWYKVPEDVVFVAELPRTPTGKLRRRDIRAMAGVEPVEQSGVNGKAAAAVVVTMVLWASAFVGIRYAGEHFEPGSLALGRLLVGAIALGAIAAVRGVGVPPKAAWPGIIGSGVFWFALYMVALNWGERHADAGTAALIVGVGPILVAFLAGWLLREGFPGRLLAGLAIAFAGVAAVGLSDGGGGSTTQGALLCLVAAAGYAVGVVAQKPALRHASALQATTFGCVVGAIVCLPFSGQLVGDLRDAPASATISVVYLGLLPTALAFYTWAYALSHMTTGKLGATTYLVPAIVVLLSWALLDEVPGLVALAGGVLCLVGVAVSRGKPKPAVTAAT